MGEAELHVAARQVSVGAPYFGVGIPGRLIQIVVRGVLAADPHRAIQLGTEGVFSPNIKVMRGIVAVISRYGSPSDGVYLDNLVTGIVVNAELVSCQANQVFAHL